MTAFDLPFIPTGSKTVLGARLLMAGGVMLALATFISMLGNCISGTLDLGVCMQKLPEAGLAVISAGSGIGILGIGHKLERLKALLPVT